jgi:7-carboxy-7-deazaguanine synthase
VICDEADYAWAKQQLLERRLNEKCLVLFSPVAGSLQPADLADWILRDRLDVRFQLQLHKLLWREDRGR